MLNISFYSLWALSYFLIIAYTVIVFSILMYCVPSIKDIINYSKFKKINNFDYCTGYDMTRFLITPTILIFLIVFSWSSPIITSWFNNLFFSSLQLKMSYLVILFFIFTTVIISSSVYFNSKEIYDFYLILFNFFLWVFFLFYSNNFFVVIFFLEIISTLIFLLLITSTFSTTYFYNNLNLNTYNYFHNSTPFFFIQMLLFFFWISLISSLNLFMSLILFYLKFLTFDWYFFEFLFFYITSTVNFKNIFFFMFIWFNILCCIFLKCGLAPFYFWKPVFFKGMSLHLIFFYITFYYFFLIIFLSLFLIIFFNDIFFYFININILMLMFGFFILLSTICEAYYLKSFLAVSSILNTIFIFLALNSLNNFDLYFFI